MQKMSKYKNMYKNEKVFKRRHFWLKIYAFFDLTSISYEKYNYKPTGQN